MLMQEPTPQLIQHWQEVHAYFRPLLRPNRKDGPEIVDYLNRHYPLEKTNSKQWKQIVSFNVLSNQHNMAKLPEGKVPHPMVFLVMRRKAGLLLYQEQDECFLKEDIYVGIDTRTGFFHVEGSSRLYDELVAFRGLDADDLENYYLVAEYIECLERFGLLSQTLLACSRSEQEEPKDKAQENISGSK